MAPKKQLLKPKKGEPCAECVMGSPTYIPCGKPATKIVAQRDGSFIAMCDMDADHNVKNRGAHLVEGLEQVELVRAADIKASLSPPSNATALPVADVEADESGPTDQQLKTISANVSRALKLQELLIPEHEAQLKKLQDELKLLTEQTIPNALVDAKSGGYVYSDRNDGKWEVELVQDVKLSVTKPKLPAFIQFLVDTKQDDLVKRKIVIKFGRDQVKLAKKFLADLAKRKIDLQPQVDEEVNWQTLNSWGKEKRQEAIDMQLDPDKALPPEVDVFKLRVVKFSKKAEKKGVAQFE